MAKRNLTTQELAIQLHTDVAEVRRLRILDAEEATIDQAVHNAPKTEEDSSAIYCYTRTDGIQHSFEHFGEKYCFLKQTCKYHRNNGNKAKFCGYKKR